MLTSLQCVVQQHRVPWRARMNYIQQILDAMQVCVQLPVSSLDSFDLVPTAPLFFV
jgi:hypothetical protein